MLEVLTLFLIPIGGGIPAGVLLARSRGIDWPMVSALYLISDVILACVFEPLILLFLRQAKRSPKMSRFAEAMKKSTSQTVMRFGVNPGPFTLILFSFGIDPMSGRIAAHAAGHKFISGWALAICGDMIFFAVIMVSTLWLNSILGDGTWTAIIIMAAMFIVPALFRKIRERRNSVRTELNSPTRMK
ncbi:MAG: hypothetical protein ACXWQE_14780 [Bdellovibrionales bacterium]